MPKYAEGTVSPSGKYVVRGGAWVPVEVSNLAPEDRRQQEFLSGSKVAANPYEEPSPTGKAIGAGIGGATALGAGALLSGGVLPFLKGAALSVGGAGAGNYVGNKAEQYLGAPEGTSELTSVAGGLAAPFVGLRGLAQLIRAAGNPRGTLLKMADRLDPKVVGGSAKSAGTKAVESAPKTVAKAPEPTEFQLRQLAAQEKKLAIMERRENRLAAKAAGKAPKPTEAVPDAPSTPPPSPDATIPASAGVTPPSAAAGHPDEQQIVSMARFLRRSSPTERAALNEWLKSQPPEVAKQLRELLAKGVDIPATNLGGRAQIRPSLATGPGYELAKLLGQVQ